MSGNRRFGRVPHSVSPVAVDRHLRFGGKDRLLEGVAADRQKVGDGGDVPHALGCGGAESDGTDQVLGTAAQSVLLIAAADERLQQ